MSNSNISTAHIVQGAYYRIINSTSQWNNKIGRLDGYSPSGLCRITFPPPGGRTTCVLPNKLERIVDHPFVELPIGLQFVHENDDGVVDSYGRTRDERMRQRIERERRRNGGSPAGVLDDLDSNPSDDTISWTTDSYESEDEEEDEENDTIQN